MAKGLLPILEKLTFIRLEFVEVRELMPKMVLHDKGTVNRNNFEWNKNSFSQEIKSATKASEYIPNTYTFDRVAFTKLVETNINLILKISNLQKKRKKQTPSRI